MKFDYIMMYMKKKQIRGNHIEKYLVGLPQEKLSWCEFFYNYYFLNGSLWEWALDEIGIFR